MKAALLVLLATAGWAQPPAAELLSISIDLPAGFIHGKGSLHSFIVTGHYQDGSRRDLTRTASYQLLESRVAAMQSPGLFRSAEEGVARITASVAAYKADAALIVLPPRNQGWDFATDVAPIFSKFGCNGANCHGAMNGQSSFKLSLFGYDTDADFEAVVTHSDGRRINRADPAKSILVTKPTFAVPHGGGQRMAPDALEDRKSVV